MSKKFIHLTNTLLFTESPGCFDLFQTFHASEGMAVTSFEIKGELFVTFSNYKHTPSRFKRKLLVYVLQKNNSFTYNQTLDSFYVQEIEYFTIHGDHFLVAANEYNGWSYRLASVVYRWEAGKFKEFQRIPTAGVKSAHYFTIDTRKLISFSNSMFGVHEVSIYKWKNDKFSNKIQDIQMRNPRRCNTFSIHNITYIACSRGYTAQTVPVMKWSGKEFEPFQDLRSSIVLGRPHIIQANGTFYLAIANLRKPGNNGNLDIDSFIYRWNGTRFVHHQSIPTHAAMGWDSFTTAGDVFLVVANRYIKSGTGSAVYKMADNKFNLYQQLTSTGAEYVHAFSHKGRQYLAVVNGYNFYTSTQDSQVYIRNSSMAAEDVGCSNVHGGHC